MEETEKSFADYLDIVRRRKYYAIVIFPVLAIVTVIVALLLPPVFRSEGIVLIENQDIPRDLVRSTVTSYAEQQIEIIRQRIMTTSNIIEIVDKYDLYSDMRRNQSASEIATKFRDNVVVSMVNADVIDPVHGRAKRASIAFKVAFLDASGSKAQKVASELITHFLDANVKSRTNKAAQTSSFLKDEADKLQKSVRLLEDKIAKFKAEYSDSLPELLQFNLSMIESSEKQLSANQSESVDVKNQLHFLNMEISSINPYLSGMGTPAESASGSVRLAQLESQYNNLSNKYSKSHPDIVRLKREITLLRESGADDNKESVATEAITNPIYRQVKFKIESSEKDLARLGQQRAQIQAELKDYEKRVAQTHQVQRGYEDLTRDYANTLSKYQELRSKQLEAEVSQSMEAENKAESFTLIEPPMAPAAPNKPNRPKVIMLGLFLSMGATVGLIMLLEILDPGIRGYREITRITGEEPLALIPVLNRADRRMFLKEHKGKIIVVLLVFFVIAVTLFHFLIMDLNLFWFKFLDKINML